MTTKPTHTPTPWYIEETTMPSLGFDVCAGSRKNDEADNHKWIGSVHGGHGDNGKTAPGFPGDKEGQANAAFIVLAVNAHEELLQALREALKFIGQHDGCSRMNSYSYEVYRVVKDAIAKAEAL